MSAYHIVPGVPAVALCGAAATTPADWCVGAGNLIVCESLGAADDRNANPAGAKHGDGGLCSTGDNLANNPAFAYGIPAPGTIIRLDTCDLTMTVRAGAACPIANTDGIKWTFDTTAFACTVWTQGQTRPTQYGLTSPALTHDDAAIYYEALYAWWDFESGDGSYTAPASGADGLPQNDPNAVSAGFPATLDNVQYHHGHVGMFIVTSNPAPVATVGSVSYMQFAGWGAALAFSNARAAGFTYPAGLTHGPGVSGTWKDGQPFVDGSPDPLTIGGQSWYNNCGPSSSGGVTAFANNMITGPAVRAI